MEFFFLTSLVSTINLKQIKCFAEHETFVVYWVNIAEKQYKQWNFALFISSLIEIIKDNK